MIVFIISTVIFLVAAAWVVHTQKRNQRRVQVTAAQFNATLSNVVPLVQKQHTMQFGRASTALESSFPGQTLPPKTKSHA